MTTPRALWLLGKHAFLACGTVLIGWQLAQTHGAPFWVVIATISVMADTVAGVTREVDAK